MDIPFASADDVVKLDGIPFKCINQILCGFFIAVVAISLDEIVTLLICKFRALRRLFFFSLAHMYVALTVQRRSYAVVAMAGSRL